MSEIMYVLKRIRLRQRPLPEVLSMIDIQVTSYTHFAFWKKCCIL